MPYVKVLSWKTIPSDLIAGSVVFLVAMPMCLGIAQASEAPHLSGVIAGIIGGVVVGLLSGSHSSVSGPAAGLIAIVAAQVASLGTFEAVSVAILLAGVFQLVIGLLQGGYLAGFIPSAVIKGLLVSIGLLLVLKQIPHVLGHDSDPEGEMSFFQPDHQNTFSELNQTLSDINPGAAVIGLVSIGILMLWSRIRVLRDSSIPAPLLVVPLGVISVKCFAQVGGDWSIGPSHLVQLPTLDSLKELGQIFHFPNFSHLMSAPVYVAGMTIAILASMETLFHLEATDRLDPRQRASPLNRELMAQGAGNMISGLLGGLPVTSVIVRSSVNINSGGQTKLSTIIHGILLLISVGWCAQWINMVPLSCLAAILLMTGVKLIDLDMLQQIREGGYRQIIPFSITLVAILMTDPLVGVFIGFFVSLGYILWSSTQRPIRGLVEQHIGGDVVRIELGNQVNFLNRASLERALNTVPRGGNVLIDAQGTDYIDPDIIEMFREYQERIAPARGIKVSLKGLGEYDRRLSDQVMFVEHTTKEIQRSLSPVQVLQILKDGHERFRSGRRLSRDLARQVNATADGQHPMAAVLSCIDSRAPVELIFDLGVGDMFVMRVAGNVISPKILGSAEYACAVAGAKLIVVLGHTRCGAVNAAIQFSCSEQRASQVTGCQHLDYILQDIRSSIDLERSRHFDRLDPAAKELFANEVSRKNVVSSVTQLVHESETLSRLVKAGTIAVIGAMYDVTSGQVDFLEPYVPE